MYSEGICREPYGSSCSSSVIAGSQTWNTNIISNKSRLELNNETRGAINAFLIEHPLTRELKFTQKWTRRLLLYLLFDEIGVEAVPLQEILVRAAFNDRTLIHNQDDIGVANCAQAMRDNDLSTRQGFH